MSINTQTPIHTNITIFVLSTRDEISYGKDIQYAIKFPTQDVFPKITLIQFNGKVLCSGNPDPLQPGAIQTSIWAKSTITTYNGGLPNHPTNQDGTNANGNAQFFFNIGAQPNNFTNNYTIASFDKSFISNNLFNNKPETIPTRTITKSPPQPFPTPERTTSIKSIATRFLDQCGVTKSTVNLIIGSGAITPGEFPWTAAIMSRQNSNYKFYCTGNLISDQHVLTAAHCVRYYNSPLFPNEDLILVLGKLNIENWASGGTIRNPSEVIAHPNYKQSQVDYDVAVIVLNAPVPYKTMTRPICLWDGSDNLKDVVGRVGTVVGWGEKQTAADSSFVQKIEIPIVSQETCLRSHKVFKKYTSPRTFCAGNRDNFSGPCTGDSGAGFMIKDEPTGRWHLRGIVGFSTCNKIMWPADSDTRIRKTSLLACCFVSLLLRVASQQQFPTQQFPTVNCPEIFRYSFDSNQGGYYGHLTVKKDGSSTSELQVNMSINTQTPIHTNIKIFVLSTREEIFYGKDIQYAIKFPTQDAFPKITLIQFNDAFPKITLIQFNGKVLCSGNPDPLQPGIIQTSMWARSTITTYNEVLPNQPTNQDGTNANGNAQFFFNIGAQPNNFTNNYPIATFDNPFISNNLFNNKPETTSTRTTTKSPPQPSPTPERTTSIKPVATKFPRQCGVTKSTVNLIIGGDAITPGEFPWIAAIMYRQKSDYKFHCTGNLISDQHVLTAAHCVRYYNSPLFPNEDLILVLGKLNIENWASGGTIRNPSEVIAHPNYKQNQVDYDVAVIVLNEPVPYKPATRPICLWESSDNLQEVLGRVGTVVGWGKNQTAADSTFAQKIEVPIVSQETCLRSHKVFKKYTSPRTFCAGNRDNFSGPCNGDSGAGFMIKDEPTGRWYLRGFVGFSIRNIETLSCDLTNYAVFIDVAKVRPWILETMQNNSGK
ncbi:Trypsin [Popillia japonica]|uniref:Trypsin n=1 Tax=Popillia japonica TaxID=7064 RepID=A0AAW1N1T9_POPJA